MRSYHQELNEIESWEMKIYNQDTKFNQLKKFFEKAHNYNLK